jgi:hypothetical protein
MQNRHEVLASARIAGAYDDVRERWLKDPLGILQRATAAGLSGLFGGKLHFALGPLEIVEEIVVDIASIESYRSPNGTPATKLVIEWGAMRSPELFPIMRATMTIYPLSSTETQLELFGTYAPPLGRVGEAADTIAMHHVAKRTVEALVGDIARLLERRAFKGSAA